MSVRKTERRIPTGFQASDLGEAVVSADGRSCVVSFISSPLAFERENVYVVYVTDTMLASAVRSFEWSFTENDGTPSTHTTEFGETTYTPTDTGSLTLVVKMLDTGNTEQARLTMTQDVIGPNPTVEALIANAIDLPGPGVANPDVIRELVNDHSPYYQNITLQTAEPTDAFQKFVFGIVFDGALQRLPEDRKQHIDDLAESLNGERDDFATLAARGAGVCGLRLALLAMTVPQSPGATTMLLDWTELPEPADQRAVADEELRQALAALDETIRIDLFNLVRCPKSNIVRCGRVIEMLRDRYFAGSNFNDVMTGMSGTRAAWITRHLREGPLHHV
jgi:hypothetical protein